MDSCRFSVRSTTGACISLMFSANVVVTGFNHKSFRVKPMGAQEMTMHWPGCFLRGKLYLVAYLGQEKRDEDKTDTIFLMLEFESN